MSLKVADTVFIVTGFVIKDRLFGETDGPLGAVSIARALNILGKNPVIITDKYSKKILKVALEVVDLEVDLEIVTKQDENNSYENLLNKYKPDCLVSMKGPRSDGWLNVF